jgi:hypothetical protein
MLQDVGGMLLPQVILAVDGFAWTTDQSQFGTRALLSGAVGLAPEFALKLPEKFEGKVLLAARQRLEEVGFSPK